MGKLLKYLKPYAASVILIVGVLIVQAFCDLSLPSYTSDIVNVGIQQGGISESIPEALTEEDMNKLLLFMGAEDAETVKAAFELKETKTGYDYDGSVYTLKKAIAEDEKEVENLADIMGRPMLLTSGFESDSDTTMQMEESMKENMKSAIQEQANAQMEAAQSQMTDAQKAMMAANPDAAKKQQEEMQTQIDAQLKKSMRQMLLNYCR